jgi:hypothetical protein
MRRDDLEELLTRWEEALVAFTNPFYMVEKPMNAPDVLRQCITELKTVITRD